MFICTLKLDRKKIAFAVIMAALVIIGIILLLGTRERAGSDAPRQSALSLTKENSRAAYLAQYGWEVETPALSEDKVVIPREFSPVFEKYNELQKQQGFDLSEYCGTEVTMYTYRVTNSAFKGDEVLAVLYVKGGSVIGGDVHSTALDGFMRPIKN